MPGGKNKIRVCYVLSYRCPGYVRTRSLIQSLSSIRGIEVLKAVNRARGIWRYPQTLLRLLTLRIGKDPDCYLLGFRGYEIFWIVRILTWGRPLILDHMMSPYDSLVHEEKLVREGGMAGRVIYLYERSILRSADIVLTDTEPHRSYLAGQFGVDAGKIHPIPVGTDEEVFKPVSVASHRGKKDLFHVLFYGSFLPLHGIDIILEGAHILQDKPIRFTIIGGRGRALKDFNEMKKRLDLNNIIHKKWVPYEQLPDMIQKADVCLGGPFGNTGQARRVITGKTFQSLAMGKPVIVGKTGHDYGFRDKKNCLLVSQGDKEELARAIRWCFENQDQLPVIGENGLQLYRERFSTDRTRKILQEILL
ncbi:MAG: glycosyltransferase [Deltaproteobacteria bacterium]|nr:glycosyltransferase [Deltaproteobacteria bacterium]